MTVKSPKETGFQLRQIRSPHTRLEHCSTKDRNQIMSTDNLIEIARQADAILGDQGDGFEGFETQMRRALAGSSQVDAYAMRCSWKTSTLRCSRAVTN